MDLLIPIVTPSYNQGEYLEATIQSVLQQDFVSFEYKVIDGESKDNSLQILKRYGSRLQWISEPDQGQAAAINKGFRSCRGEVLGWLNADDPLKFPLCSKSALRWIWLNRDHPGNVFSFLGHCLKSPRKSFIRLVQRTKAKQ